MMKWAYILDKLMEHVCSQRDVLNMLRELYLNQRNRCPLNTIGSVFLNIYILRDVQRRKYIARCKNEAFMGTQDKTWMNKVLYILCGWTIFSNMLKISFLQTYIY